MMVLIQRRTIMVEKSFHFMMLLGLSAALLPGAVSAADDGQRTITVYGTADVSVTPDEVLLSLSVSTLDKDLAASKRRNDETVAKVLALTKTNAIDEKHVQTSQVTIRPDYDYSSAGRNFLGFRVQKEVDILLSDLSKFEPFLSALLEAGVQDVNGITFRTTEFRKHRDHARALAIQAAREKAIALAAQLGQGVGKPIRIDEEQAPPHEVPAGFGNRQVAVEETGEAEFQRGLAAGQISLQARVKVTFELVDAAK
jgi:uncharacterized protein